MEPSRVMFGLVMLQNSCLDTYFICKNRIFHLPGFSLVKKNPSLHRQGINLLFFDKPSRAECNPLPIRLLEIFINRNKLSTQTKLRFACGAYGEKLMKGRSFKEKIPKGVPLNSLYSLYHFAFNRGDFFHPN